MTILRDYAKMLPHCSSFRDMGGIPLGPDRISAPRLLYRSGRLSHLSDYELKLLEELKIGMIIDLRAPDEIEMEPDRIPEGAGYRNFRVKDEVLGFEYVADLFRRASAGEVDTREFMKNHYREMHRIYTEVWGEIFSSLAASEYTPTIVHCTGGKDRTGLFSALFLLLLGAEHDQVVEDYLLSGFHGKTLKQKAVRYALKFREEALPIDPKVTYPFLTTLPEFLLAAIDGIVTDYSSLSAYYREGLGLTADQIERIRNRFIQRR